MALTPPTAPTPPTPPTAPQVEFSGGGSVTESTTPASGYQSPEQVQENAARAAVARGDGPLSRTTQASPADQGSQDTGQSGSAQPAQSAQTGGDGGQLGTTTQTTREGGPSDADRILAQGGQQTQQAQAADIPPSPSYHGALFWGVTLVALFVAALLVFRVVMHRRGASGELSVDDIDFAGASRPQSGAAGRTAASADVGSAAAGAQEPPAAGTLEFPDDIMAEDGLRGMTAAEALAAIEDEEQRELAAMRERRRRYMRERNAANERREQQLAAQLALEQSAPPGGREPETAADRPPRPVSQPQRQAASYAENQPEGAELHVLHQPEKKPPAEPQHFEVRI